MSDQSVPPRLQLAIERLTSGSPVLGALARHARKRPDPAIRHMCLDWVDGELTLHYSPAIIDSITLHELVGLLSHEMRHLIYGHVFMDPEQYDSASAMVIAQEITVNQGIAEPLPGSPIRLEDYPRLSPADSADDYYQQLMALKLKTPTSVDTLTDRSHWPQLLDQADAIRLQLQFLLPRLAQQVRASPSPDPSDLLMLASAADLPGDRVRELIGDPPEPSVTWRRVLQRFVRRTLHAQPTLSLPSRRLPHLVGLVPGKAPRPQRHRVTVVLDTSGSITDADLRAFSAELQPLSRTSDVTVIECDAAVRAVYRYRGDIRQVSGGGGTDLRPPFTAVVEQRLNPDCLVYFTDGEGPAPDRAPPYPVLWLLTRSGSRPTDWGEEARLDGGPSAVTHPMGA